MSFILVHAILRYIRTHAHANNGEKWRKCIHPLNDQHKNTTRRKKIIRKIIDRLCACVFMFKRIDSKILADPRHNEKRFIKVSHVCARIFLCILFGWMSEADFFFLVQTRKKIKNVESKIYCRCRYHFIAYCSLVCVRSHTKLFKSQILMKFESINVIFLAMMLYQRFSCHHPPQQYQCIVSVFFCECMGLFWRYFCHMKSFYVCFMADEPFWILKAKYYVESWMNVSFWFLYEISFGFEIKHADSKKKK